jgi:hypothetical protein
MRQTIIILTKNKFDKRDYFRFGVDKCLAKGYKVFVYDLSHILRPIEYQLQYNPKDLILDDYVVRIKDYADFEAQIKKEESKICNVLCFINLYPDTERLFTVLSNWNLPYSTFKLGVLPEVVSAGRYWSSRTKYFIWYHFLRRKIHASAYHVIAGQKSIGQPGAKVGKNSEVIFCGSLDYNKYVEFKEKEIHPNEADNKVQIVFVDEFYPLHPDLNGAKFIDPAYYYSKMNMVLKRLEQELLMKVSIAVHPRADYTKNPFEFPLIYNRTMEAISEAKLIVGHASTAFSYAVLMDKPILQVGFKSVSNHFYGKGLTKFSQELGLKTFYVDSDSLYTYPVVNRKKYAKYISNYLNYGVLDENVHPISALLKRMDIKNRNVNT